MNSIRFLTTRAGLIGLGAALVLPLTRARADDAPANADAFPSYDSYIKISGEAPWIDGDNAAYAARSQVPNSGAYGIEDLLYTKDINNGPTLTFSGRALSGTEDYLASLNVTEDNFGSIEIGYKRFRTFYDAVGGFFPLTGTFEAMSPQQLHIDRSAFWFDAKLARPDAPVFTVSFHDEIRTGEKDSTEWAAIINPNAVVVGGVLQGTALPSNTPLLNPNVLSVAEHHDILEASVTDTLGKTTETFRATFDWVNNLDTRYYVRYPGSVVTADPMVSVLDDQEGVASRTFRLLNQTETALGAHFAIETGLTYFHDSGSDGGEWITPTYSSTANAIYPAVTAGNIYTSPEVNDYVGNIFLKYTPTPDWLAEAGFRAESQVISDGGGFETTTLASGATTIASTNITTANDVTYSHFTDHTSTPELDLTYHGIPNVSLYGTFDKQIDNGNQHWINPYAAVTTTGTGTVTTAGAPISSVFFQQANQDYEDAKLGANWAPCSEATLRIEVFRKDHQNDFIGANDIVGTGSYGGLYATGYTFTGMNLSVIVKPAPDWSFNTRYQPQDGNMSVTGNSVTGGDGSEVTSGKARTQMISETVDWAPIRQFYAEGSVNIVFDYIQTAYPTVVPSTTAAIASPIVNANNNYATGSALCGFVLSKLTDATIEGVWQHATNYNPQIAYGGEPYGATFLYESVTCGLKHKFNDRMLGEGKLGYLRATDGTTGGFTNYRGPLAYLGLTFEL